MSVVWAATHTVTGKAVALKMLKGDAAQDEAIRRRMFREARAACAVVHPNVLQIHDVLELEDGAPVLVMDLLAGESLRDRLTRSGSLPLEETVTLLLPVVSGVGTAHAAGVIHRDLKPENIFLAEEAGEVRVKVLDFGIAKLISSSGVMSTSNALTNAGTMLGTPYYMAPEQILGESIDHRADIWSIGIILYECLSGERPTEAENIGKILRRVITHDIGPLSAAVPDLPADIHDLVDRMLAADPCDRPASLHEVREVLSAHTPGVSCTSFGPPTRAPSLADDTGERRAVSALTAIEQVGEDGAPSSRRRVSNGSGPEYAETLVAAHPSEPPARPRTSDPAPRRRTSDPASRRRSSAPAPAKETESREEPKAPARAPRGMSGAPRALFTAAAAVGLAGAGAAGYLGVVKGGGRSGHVPATATIVDVSNTPCPAGMGLVPGGRFRMGSADGKSDEQPVHEVSVATFCMDLAEVTARAYKECTERGACVPAESTVKWQTLSDEERERESLACTGYQTGPADLPLNCVSWDAADAYCRAEGKRLPTEAEWEYAAGGGSEHRLYPWGNAAPSPALLNVCDRSCAEAVEKRGGVKERPMFEEDDGAPGVAVGGRFPAGDSKFGMHDMAGNVWEWTASPYCTYPEHDCNSHLRVFRGGGWGGRYVTNLRVTARMWSHPSHRYNDVGFRCVKDVR